MGWRRAEKDEESSGCDSGEILTRGDFEKKVSAQPENLRASDLNKKSGFGKTCQESEYVEVHGPRRVSSCHRYIHLKQQRTMAASRRAQIQSLCAVRSGPLIDRVESYLAAVDIWSRRGNQKAVKNAATGVVAICCYLAAER